MAKGKPAGVQNRHLYSRVSFLYQAAAYLASPQDSQRPQQPEKQHASNPLRTGNLERPDQQRVGNKPQPPEVAAPAGEAAADESGLDGMACRLLTDLRAVSRKAQIRLTSDIKQTICKFCDSLLIEGVSCTTTVENQSKGSLKPWADVLVITCSACGRQKRYPVHTRRQKRRPARQAKAEQEAAIQNGKPENGEGDQKANVSGNDVQPHGPREPSMFGPS